jgi:hypothetical protein
MYKKRTQITREIALTLLTFCVTVKNALLWKDMPSSAFCKRNFTQNTGVKMLLHNKYYTHKG